MNARAWFCSQSFNSSAAAADNGIFKIMHMGTGNLLPYNFDSREDAQKWIDSYGVSQRYKDENYKIVTRW